MSSDAVVIEIQDEKKEGGSIIVLRSGDSQKFQLCAAKAKYVVRFSYLSY